MMSLEFFTDMILPIALRRRLSL